MNHFLKMNLSLELPRMFHISEDAMSPDSAWNAFRGQENSDIYVGSIIYGTKSPQMATNLMIYHMDIIHWVLQCIITGCLCMVGFITNTLTFVVLLKDPRKNITTILLMCLTVTDILTLLYLVTAYVLPSLFLHLQKCHYFFAILRVLPYIWPFSTLAQMWMTWIIVLATCFRFIVVRFPLHSQKYTNTETGLKILGVTMLACFLFNLPRIIIQFFPGEDCDHGLGSVNSQIPSNEDFKNQYPSLQNLNDTLSTKDCFKVPQSYQRFGYSGTNASCLYANFWYQNIYYIGLTWIFMYIVPLLLLLLLNINLSAALTKALKAHADLTKSNRKSHNTLTVNVVAIVTVFLVCQTPDFIGVVLTLPKFRISSVILTYFLSVNVVLLAINSTANFFIYFMYYPRFRLLAKNLLECKRIQRKSSMNSSSKNTGSKSNITLSSVLTKKTKSQHEWTATI